CQTCELPLLGSNQDSPDPESYRLGRHFGQLVGKRPLPEHRCPPPGRSLPALARRNYGKTTAPSAVATICRCSPGWPVIPQLGLRGTCNLALPSRRPGRAHHRLDHHVGAQRQPIAERVVLAGETRPSCKFGFRIGPSFDEHHSVPVSRAKSLSRQPRVDVFDPGHLADGKGS
ncbi:MAG: hypothetical protein K0S19_1030, partial [Geminicoccaceae bacterium]|nr:hypothetical protein [Geminicoccaceae bacterium]